MKRASVKRASVKKKVEMKLHVKQNFIQFYCSAPCPKRFTRCSPKRIDSWNAPWVT